MAGTERDAAVDPKFFVRGVEAGKGRDEAPGRISDLAQPFRPWRRSDPAPPTLHAGPCPCSKIIRSSTLDTCFQHLYLCTSRQRVLLRSPIAMTDSKETQISNSGIGLRRPKARRRTGKTKQVAPSFQSPGTNVQDGLQIGSQPTTIQTSSVVEAAVSAETPGEGDMSGDDSESSIEQPILEPKVSKWNGHISQPIGGQFGHNLTFTHDER